MTDVPYDPGSSCETCPHPLDRHGLEIDATETPMKITVTCQDCSCRMVSYAQTGKRGHQTARLNPQARAALGSVPWGRS